MKTKRWLPMVLCCLPGVAVGVLVGVGIIFVGNVRINRMDANSIFLLLMGLACPIGMGLMMWLMNKQTGHQPEYLSADKHKPINPASRLTALQEQRQQLEAEIAELSQIVELEAEQESWVQDGSPVVADDSSPAAAHSAN